MYAKIAGKNLKRLKMVFKIHMPVNVISGNNCVIKNSKLFGMYGEKCLIITGKSSAEKCGALNDVVTAIEANGIQYEIFNKIGANPLLSVCAQAGYYCSKNKINFIVAIGGGSPLDAAKAAAIYATNAYFEHDTDIYNKDFKNTPLPLIVVGTTAGTGSEVSAGAVLSVDSTNRKVSISCPECYPDVALCDPKYTYNIPRYITISTALDAFAHATEGWFSRKRNMVTQAFANESLPTIWETLKTLANGETLTEEQRDNIYYALLSAGMVLSIGTTYPHGLGYVLTENYNVPHGQACAVFDAHLIEWSNKYAPDIASEYLALIGADINEVESVLDKLIDIPEEVSFNDDELAKIAVRWDDTNSKFKNVYGNFTTKTALKLLKELFGE